MTLWDKNHALIKKRHPALLPLEPPHSLPDYFLKDSKFGAPVPGVIRNKKKNLLSSLYRKNSLRQSPSGHQLRVFIGIMNLLLTEEELDPSHRILLIEPQKELFLFLMQHFDMENLLNHPSLDLFIGPELKDLQDFMQGSYSPYLDGMMDIQLHDPSNRIFSETYQPFLHYLRREKDTWSVEWATQKHFSQHWFRNILHNMTFKGSKKGQKVPRKVIILAAGPSIEAFLESGQAIKGEADIVAVDTLLPLLVELDIPVNWVISMDCQISSYHHYLKGCPSSANPIMDISVHNLLPRIAGEVYFTGNPHPLVQLLCPDLPVLNTGLGNVTAFAMDAMIQLGAEEIEIFGADFSFPRGKAYSRGTYLVNHFLYHSNRLDTQENKMYGFSSRSVLSREGIQRTTARLENYQKTLRRYIESFSPLHMEEEKGHWIIRIPGQKKKTAPSTAGGNARIKEYRNRLQSVKLEGVSNGASFFHLSPEDRQCISTLFPLLTLYFDQYSWKQSLVRARNWALDQLRALEAMEA